MAGAAPVNIIIPAPAIADAPLHIDANDPLVAGLPWLSWEPAPPAAGIPRVSLRHHEAMAAFGIKCKLARHPLDVAAFAIVNILNLKFSVARWTEILTALRDGGLAGRTIRCTEELHSYIHGMSRPAPDPFEISRLDWVLFPNLIAGGNAPQRVLSLRIRYLSLANVGQLELTSGPLALTAPWTIICKLSGALGAVGTHVARVVLRSEALVEEMWYLGGLEQ